MPTQLYTHSVCIDHDPGEFHPESPNRLKAVLSALESESFHLLQRMEAPEAERSQLERVHLSAYVEEVFSAVPQPGPQSRHRHLDPDTVLSPASGDAALRAAGGVCAAVDAVLGGTARNAFCAVRPPGHHAERDRAMGFCFFNNVAIGSEQARQVHGIRKVAIVDFDVHHGNGSQSYAEGDRDLFYASSHQWPAYPGTGPESETGQYRNIVNVCLPPGSGSDSFRKAYEQRIFPALRAFAPELLMISAGFDAHVRDPLCQLNVETEDFAWITRELLGIAQEVSSGRVVSVLEGGYDLAALAACARVHVKTLMDY
ncbi:MAG: histone deacetylase family protein [Rhodospirillales bacterium]|nr:histone deacetylase family protein [Rhodospirillales bacterium]